MQGRLRRCAAALPAAVAAFIVGSCLSSAPASAQCTPDPASSGQTVTCSGNDADGFQAGGGVNALTVNVLPGAVVSDNGTAAISVNDANVVTNSGTLTAGTGSVGIFAGVNNTITNAATGVITAGNNGLGIYVAGGSTVTNAGAITIGSTFGLAAGIFAINDNNTVINAAGASITAGDGASGIVLQGNNGIVTNAGAIGAGDVGNGIFVIGNDAQVTNGGTITVTDDAAGISLLGERAVVTNGGTINAGVDSAGIAVNSLSATITNNGTISGGDGTRGIVVLGNSNSIVNRGTITVGAGFAVGIDVTSLGGSNTVVNTGTINVGAGATGILVSGTGTVFNAGTINAATGFAAIEFCGCGTGNVLTLGPGSLISGLVLGTGTDTFQLGGTGSATFNLGLIGTGQQYDGFSTFNKVDSSNWTVTGTGAQDWNVLGGTLTVNGAITGLVSVNTGGTLAGTGAVGDTTVSSGGALAPGNGTAGSSLTVANLAFQSGALYLVTLSSTTSTFASVTGNAALNGTVVASFLPGSTVLPQYRIMEVGSSTGNFSGVDAPGGLVGTVSFGANAVFLNFALDWASKYNLNINQANVARTLVNQFNVNGTIPAAFASLTPAGLTQVSGELATGSQQATFDAVNLFLSLLTDPFAGSRNGGLGDGGSSAAPFAGAAASAYAANKPGGARNAFAKFPTKADVARNDLLDTRWSVWGSVFGGGSNTSGHAGLGSNSATARAFGFAAGADYRISPATLAGFALAGGGTNFAVSGFGSGRSDMFQAGAFVRHTAGRAYVTAAAAYAWQDVTTDRTVTAAGVERLHAQFNANTSSARVEGGYRYVTPWMGITPYAAGQVTIYSLPAYAEQVLAGAGAFALNYAARDVTAARTELGVRTDRSFAMHNGVLTLRGRAAWAHDFNTDRNVTAVFQTLPGAGFVVNGAAQAHDSALLTGAAEMKWLNRWSAAAVFEGQFSSVTNSYAGKGVARYSW